MGRLNVASTIWCTWLYALSEPAETLGIITCFRQVVLFALFKLVPARKTGMQKIYEGAEMKFKVELSQLWHTNIQIFI